LGTRYLACTRDRVLHRLGACRRAIVCTSHAVHKHEVCMSNGLMGLRAAMRRQSLGVKPSLQSVERGHASKECSGAINVVACAAHGPCGSSAIATRRYPAAATYAPACNAYRPSST
jgi:hypothetical protein